MTSINRDELLSAGIPEPIVAWVSALPENERSQRYAQRAQRFVDYWRANPNDESAAKAWVRVAGSARSDDSLISFFISFPDQLTTQPFALVFGTRVVDPGEEKKRYAERLKQVRGVLELLDYRHSEFANLLRDAMATGGEVAAATKFRAVAHETKKGLGLLADLLAKVDPFAKIQTAHWKAPDAGRKIYIGLVSGQSRHLIKPQWEAIATLANVNLPEGDVSADDLKKHSKRSARTNPRDKLT